MVNFDIPPEVTQAANEQSEELSHAEASQVCSAMCTQLLLLSA
jgi:hypothetical protein